MNLDYYSICDCIKLNITEQLLIPPKKKRNVWNIFVVSSHEVGTSKAEWSRDSELLLKSIYCQSTSRMVENKTSSVHSFMWRKNDRNTRRVELESLLKPGPTIQKVSNLCRFQHTWNSVLFAGLIFQDFFVLKSTSNEVILYRLLSVWKLMSFPCRAFITFWDLCMGFQL